MTPPLSVADETCDLSTGSWATSVGFTDKSPNSTTAQKNHSTSSKSEQATAPSSNLSLRYISLLGLDLIEKPTSLPDSTAWISQDLFNLSPFPTKADHTNIVICNLILHHFSHEQLSQLSALFNKTDHLLTVEPHRATLPQLMGRLSFPLFNHVTRHDMIASIKAGFQKNEMALYFKDWDIITETIDPKGGLRLHLSQLAPNDISS